MPLIKSEENESGLLLLWEISESLEQIINLAQEFTKDPTFQKITHPKRQKEWLAVRLLYKSANCNQEQFFYNEIGQPCVNHPQFHSISISHSSNLVGVFLCRDKMAGLDIEASERNFARVEKKYLSTEESAMAQSIADGLGWFWCIKEAAYKAAGIPGLSFRDQIKIYRREDDALGVEVLDKSTIDFNIHQQKFSGQLIVYLTVRN